MKTVQAILDAIAALSPTDRQRVRQALTGAEGRQARQARAAARNTVIAKIVAAGNLPAETLADWRKIRQALCISPHGHLALRCTPPDDPSPLWMWEHYISARGLRHSFRAWLKTRARTLSDAA